MLTNFNDSFQQFVFQRWGEIGDSLLKNEEYTELRDKQIELLHKIETLLTEEGKALLEEYNNIETEMECMSIDLVYKEALKDGFQLKSILKVVS